MAELQIIYDANDEIGRIIKCVEEHVDMKKEETVTFDFIQNIIQKAFDDGRKFQGQLSAGSHTIKDLPKVSI